MTLSRPHLLVLALPFFLAASACGEEAVPGDGSDSDSDDHTGDGSFYPLIEGASWTYAVQNADRVTTNTKAFSLAAGTEPDTFILSDGDDDETMVRDGTRTLRVGEVKRSGNFVEELIDYDPGFVRADEEWATATVGDTFDYAFTQTMTDANGDNPVVEERTHQFTLLSVSEDVVTQAGTFDAIHVSRETTEGDQVGHVVEFWFARGIGPIQLHQHSLANPDPDLAIEEEWEVLLAVTMP